MSVTSVTDMRLSMRDRIVLEDSQKKKNLVGETGKGAQIN